MIYLFGNRADETYTYRRVSWDWEWDGDEPHAGPHHFEEETDLGNVTSGAVELSAFSDLKSTCSFNFDGEAPGTDDLIRIYYSFTDDDEVSESFCLGTFFIGYSRTDNTGDYLSGRLMASGSAEGWSVLKVLQDVKILPFLTYPAGTNPIAAAAALIRGQGLAVAVGEESSYVLASDHTFDDGDSLLTVVNWLCTTAGYQAPYPDEWGTVQITRYVSPDERTPVAEFADDDESILYPTVSIENDWQSIPNVFKMYYSTDELALAAEARNESGSKASLAARGGRELSMIESVSELAGDTTQAKLDNLIEMAAQRLMDNSQEIERIELSHPYVPLVQNDSVKVAYMDRSWTGSVQNMHIELTPSTRCDTTLRRFVPASIVVEASGAIEWEVTEE